MDGSSAKIVVALQADGPLVALVAAFQNDAWDRSGDLAHLTQAHPKTVEILSSRCGADHCGAYHGCGVEPVAGTARA